MVWVVFLLRLLMVQKRNFTENKKNKCRHTSMYAHIKLVHSESGNYKADSILGKKITKLKLASPLVFSFPQSLSPQLQLCLFPISSLLVKRDEVVNSVGKKGQQPAGKMFFFF